MRISDWSSDVCSSDLPNLIPRRAQLPHAEQVALFVRMVEALSATTAEVATEREVPAAIADYLAQNNLPPEFRMAPDAWLQSLPRSEGRRVGNECVRTGRSRWSTYH